MQKIILLTAVLLTYSTMCFSQTRLTLSPALLYFNYTEFTPSNKVLDRELGWLPGVKLSVSHTFDSDWSVDMFSAYYQGAVDYVGQTQSGTPLTTDTDTKLLRFGARIEKGIYKNVRLFAGAQNHQWNRNINDTAISSGLDETYKWLEYSVGLKTNITINKNNIIDVDVAYLITRNATIEVDLSNVDLGSTELDIADGTGGRINLGWKTAYNDHTRIGLSLFFEAWDFGRSNTKPTQGGNIPVFVTEPRSETRNSGLQFNIEYSF